jgi:hypothetical protein
LPSEVPGLLDRWRELGLIDDKMHVDLAATERPRRR